MIHVIMQVSLEALETPEALDYQVALDDLVALDLLAPQVALELLV